MYPVGFVSRGAAILFESTKHLIKWINQRKVLICVFIKCHL